MDGVEREEGEEEFRGGEEGYSTVGKSKGILMERDVLSYHLFLEYGKRMF